MDRRPDRLHRHRGDPGWADEVRRLAKARNATILAHNYQLPAIQDIADHTGDSLALSRIAAEADEDEIIFCGVHFMAETAKILSPDKRVMIPDARAGCSLADSITAEDLRAWKAEFPDAVVVSYVNTTAEVKGLTDICCTSSNAVDVVASIDPDRDVLFLPDQFLGAHVKRQTGRDNIHIWAGECHARRDKRRRARRAAESHPDADLFIHPEVRLRHVGAVSAGEGPCPRQGEDPVHRRDARRRTETKASQVLVATEIGMLHQLRKAAPGVDFQPVNGRASCPYMKMITPAALLRCLVTGQDEVDVDLDVAAKARASVEKMIAIGNPGSGE